MSSSESTSFRPSVYSSNSHTSTDSDIMRILVAEDEKKVASFINKALREIGYTVDMAHTGTDALKLASENNYDTIILDIMLPGRDGLSVLKLLRDQRNPTPIMILTARGEVSERIEGLELGADDYMAKPFAMRELLARVASLTRRAAPERATLLKIADLTMNLLTREVTRGGEAIHLPVREFSLLEYLLRAPGRVHTRTNLSEQIWGHHFDSGTNVVDVYIKRLRKKIDEGHDLKLLHTVRGVGYVLKEDAA